MDGFHLTNHNEYKRRRYKDHCLLLVVAVNGQIHKTIRISPFVIIPRNNLVEIVIEGNTGSTIDNRRSGVVNKVLRDDTIVRVSKNTLHFVLGCRLESRLDFLTGAGLFGANGQIHKRDIRSWDL
jgi:hypothetical protein